MGVKTDNDQCAVFISGCMDNQCSEETKTGGGKLTCALVDCLNKNPNVTLRELHAGIHQGIKDQNGKQIPCIAATNNISPETPFPMLIDGKTSSLPEGEERVIERQATGANGGSDGTRDINDSSDSSSCMSTRTGIWLAVSGACLGAVYYFRNHLLGWCGLGPKKKGWFSWLGF